MPDTPSASPVEPSLGQALVPVVLLIALLGAAVYLFGDESSFGPNQIALVLGTAVAGLVGLANGRSWAEIEGAIKRGIATSMGAVLILLVVGSVIGTWILAGIVPTMIHYGLSLLAPSIFYAAACAICAVVALATGSSWTTAGTVGLALIGTAAAYDLHPGIAAGAIISGAYFGDKMSPLSDTTNLAPAVAGSELFTHIRHMVWTTAPSFGLALILFAAIGLATPAPEGAGDLDAVLAALDRSFALGPHLLIPLVLVLTLVVRRMPAFPALLIGALVGGLFAIVFQQEAVLRYVGEPELARPVALVKGVWQALHGGYVLEAGNPALDELLSRGGMASMLQTVWLIMTAMMATGILQALARRILYAVRSAGGLIVATLATAFGVNVLASDQYISIVLPGRMFRSEYERRRLDPKNLSRSLEDSGTITSVLIPWNTCGAFMAQTLGVSTLTYAPFAFFNLINPLVAAVYGFARIGIAPLDSAAAQPPGTAPDRPPSAA
ncbi:MAG: Na+/H+ antiporter NhaC [Acidobacteria bacterium]|nr:Na+/H+ antiporter NhaC [Acidobacteriota bacterium]